MCSNESVLSPWINICTTFPSIVEAFKVTLINKKGAKKGHWGPLSPALELYGVTFNPFWANTGNIPMKICLGMTSPRVLYGLPISDTIKNLRGGGG